MRTLPDGAEPREPLSSPADPGVRRLDPLTHVLLGAAAAQAAVAVPAGDPRAARHVGAAGGLGALLPDADRLIHSAADPLLHVEFHRHFTHALAFIPVGGALGAAVWMLDRRRRAHWRRYLAASMAGYATHGVLDAATTYGTRLFWPFSDVRVAWNWISIVDPLFTGLLLIGLLMVRRTSTTPTGARAATAGRDAGRSSRGSSRRRAALVIAAAFAYLAAGASQRDRALAVQQRLAGARGHVPVRAEVFPAFATNVIWRSLYEADGALFMDRIRVPWVGSPEWRPGTSVPRLEPGELERQTRAGARLRRDIERFHSFSNGWLARAPLDPGFIGDARYSRSPTAFDPVWGIRLHPQGTPPVEWVNRSATRRVDPVALWREIAGADSSYRPVP